MARTRPLSGAEKYKHIIFTKLGLKKTDAEKDEIFRAKYLTAQLPEHELERSLTLPSALGKSGAAALFKKKSKTRPYDQSQSYFFGKLPLELRLVIYDSLLGGQLMHIIHFKDGLACIQCFDNNQPAALEHSCWRRGWAGLPIGGPTPGTRPHLYAASTCDPNRTPVKRLAVLLTSRRAYSEAVNILYSHNSFSFTHLESIFHFSKQVQFPRLDQIRAVEINWNPSHLGPFQTPPYDNETWNALWRHLAGFSALRKLIVRLEGRGVLYAPMWELILPLFEPMCLVRQTDDFRVEVPPLDRSKCHDQILYERFDRLITCAPFRLVELPALRP